MFLGNMDKGQATAIVLIVAGVIEAILLLALLRNLAKRAKTKSSSKEAMNLFDNSPTSSSYNFAYQDQTPTPEPIDNNSFNNDMNQDMAAVAAMDSGIPSMDYNQDVTAPTEYNQDSTFDGANLMDMQMNDTLNVPDNTMNYDEGMADNLDTTNQGFTTEESSVVGEPAFGSLENLPDIIDDTNSDNLPTESELGSDPSEIVQPMDDGNVNPETGIPEMTFETPLEQSNDYEITNQEIPENVLPEVNFETPVDSETDLSIETPDINADTNLDSQIDQTMDYSVDNQDVMPDVQTDNQDFYNSEESDINVEPQDINSDIPMETDFNNDIGTGLEGDIQNINNDIEDINTGLDTTPDMNYDTPVDIQNDYNSDLPDMNAGLDNVSDMSYDTPTDYSDVQDINLTDNNFDIQDTPMDINSDISDINYEVDQSDYGSDMLDNSGIEPDYSMPIDSNMDIDPLEVPNNEDV